ncbi:MAG: DUF1214 domain-containing protein [Haliea sp.]|nr:DUF1214 domain-containing protein [Haliea sp.]
MQARTVRQWMGWLLGSYALASAMVHSVHAAGPDAAAIIEHRQESLAYAIGLQAYFYGYPVVDYLRVMRDQTTPGRDAKNVYAPLNQIVFQEGLATPGGLYAGRGPNSSTLYFTAWLDVSTKPLHVDVPATDGRYYVLTWADLYSEVQHTGRRTTGTAAQRLLVAGPDWQGSVPEGVHLVRLATHQGYLLGRILVESEEDLATASGLMQRIGVSGGSEKVDVTRFPDAADLTSLEFFEHLNTFLRSNPRLPEEAQLMAQMNQLGLGPATDFNAELLPPGLRRGLERAVADGHRILADSARAAPLHIGWSKLSNETYGSYGFDYLRRATVEYHGFLGNQPDETVYLSALTDSAGAPLHGSQRYELVFTADALPPAAAFWALNVYDAQTVDLIPNALGRYAITDRMPDLKRREDGSVVVRLQQNPPSDPGVNWLPVNDGPLFVTLRFFEPEAAVLSGAYTPPPVEVLP